MAVFYYIFIAKKFFIFLFNPIQMMFFREELINL